MRTSLSLLAAISASVLAVSSQFATATPWSFGVMGDTQWSGSDPTGRNVNSVAVNQIKACNTQFINAGVSFVVQVGDLTDNGSNAGLQTRLNCNADLTAAGIPFYGLRGNHEDGSTNSNAQTFFNANYIPSSTAAHPVVVGPDTSSYAVTFNNVKIVLLDIKTTDGDTTKLNAATTWMGTQLSAADHEQAFVFEHKNLLGQNHKDNMFGSSNEANTTQQNAYMKVLKDNGVRYDISGHDHMDHRSMVTSPDGTSKVQELICSSDSYKYYTPQTPYSSRETPISQQLGETGYYIFTVDGPRVIGKYYHSTPLSNGDVDPNAVWKLGETFGYSLNGKEFLVAANASFSVVQDSYHTTRMSLSGVNASNNVKTYDGRVVSKDINTGWSDRVDGFASDILTLWGMEDIDAVNAAAPFTVTMSYNTDPLTNDIYIAQQNGDGSWSRLASTLNADGTVSAVATHDGNFAVVPEPASIALLILGGSALLARRRRA